MYDHGSISIWMVKYDMIAVRLVLELVRFTSLPHQARSIGEREGVVDCSVLVNVSAHNLDGRFKCIE
jgi:hypothetical protein